MTSKSIKPYKSYVDQVALLRSRGMEIKNAARAAHVLATRNYYRLSGYWYSARIIDFASGKPIDNFQPGTSLDLCTELYEFDARLRSAVFTTLAPIELALRALLGYHLGKVDPLVHMDVKKLNAVARASDRKNPHKTQYEVWLSKYKEAVRSSQEDFVAHHRDKYDGQLPVWVAVEIMDWGMLSHLYRFSPHKVRNEIANLCAMTAPQLESTLKSLNILRNLSAHHARIFNRGFDIKPKPIDHELMKPVNTLTHRLFGQISIIQFLHIQLGLEGGNLLANTLETFPHNKIIPFERTGAPNRWRDLPLWAN